MRAALALALALAACGGTPNPPDAGELDASADVDAGELDAPAADVDAGAASCHAGGAVFPCDLAGVDCTTCPASCSFNETEGVCQ